MALPLRREHSVCSRSFGELDGLCGVGLDIISVRCHQDKATSALIRLFAVRLPPFFGHKLPLKSSPIASTADTYVAGEDVTLAYASVEIQNLRPH